MLQEELELLLVAPLAERKALLEQWNVSYRLGTALVDDQVYDSLLESLPLDDEFRQRVGFEVSDQRKTALPIPMYSMDKVKSVEEIHKWMESKRLLSQEKIVITPKFDGLSFLVQPDSGRAYTRGNGSEGQRSDSHFAMLMSKKNSVLPLDLLNRYLIGEVIMPRNVFEENYSQDYRNPRNLVAGLFNQKEAQEALKDVHFIAYGLGDEAENKEHALQLLNQYNTIALPMVSCALGELTEDFLLDLFSKWNVEFELDGLILEINDLPRRRELGREKNNNPCYARAWKGFEASSALSTIRGIQYQVSKDGRLSVVGQLDPIELDGVTVSNVTLNNVSMMVERGWGIGAKVRVIRSGMVIPKIVGTDLRSEPVLPTHCPSCQTELTWSSSGVQLICPNTSQCPAQQIQTAIAFFKIMEIDEVGEKIVEQLYEAGYDSILKICAMEAEDFLKLDRFAEKRAQLIHSSIHSKLKAVPLEQIQHASACFKGLGRKKLALLAHFSKPELKPSLDEVLKVDGFSDITAHAYLAGFRPFWEFVAPLPLRIAEKEAHVDRQQGFCTGLKFCFTGFRDKDMEKAIVAEGGEILSAVSGKTTHVITKDPSSSSSKIQKARELGLLVWGPEELKSFMTRQV
jgi:DNA ligase (NAD+)